MADLLFRLRTGENIAETARRKELGKIPNRVSREMLKSLGKVAKERHVNVLGLLDEDEWVASPPFQLPGHKEYGTSSQMTSIGEADSSVVNKFSGTVVM